VTNWCDVDIDIDDKKRADEALRTAQEQLARAAQIGIAGELLASIADAINQPLTAVVANGYACQRWLSESPPNWGRATRVVNRIVEDGTAAADVVRRIHKIVTRTGTTKTPLDINRAIVVVLTLQDLEIRKHAIVVSTSLDADLPVIQADVTLIQQVLANLIRNGIDAMSVQSNVQRLLNIKSRYGDGLVIVEIADNGVGFADQAPIFEPLYSTKAEGLGLGLAIAKSIVESYAGSLWSLHNQPHGSIFGFSLPA
jgi:C4-dicarboxylate-specific signal transduction histidine kinase